MNDEELMKALGRAARAERPADERWDALAADRLSDAERAQLGEEAAQSAAAADAYEAYRPLGPEFRARVVERLSREVAQTAQPQRPPSNVVPFSRRVARRIMPLALAASVLVAVGLVVLRGPGGAVPLPGYALRLDGQVELLRGETPPPASAPFANGNRFRLVLTPERSVQGEVVARAYVVADTGEPAPLAAPAARIADSGAVLIEGEVGSDVRLPRGQTRLLVVVGREAKLPEAGALARELGDAGQRQGEDWSAWMLPLLVE